MTIRRRDALKRIGGLAAAAGMAKFLPGCGDNNGTDRPVGITTYVYLMMENRSYDHVFGARSLVEGKGGQGFSATLTMPDLNGTPVAPYTPAGRDATCVLDPPHGWDASHNAFNAGAMDHFLREHQLDHGASSIEAMQYLTREQMPVSYALADAYTVCDRWFCSVMGPTLPNRAYWHAATSFGLKGNSEVLNTFSAGVPIPTIYNRLEDKGVDWAYYYGNLAVVSLLGQEGPYKVDLGPNDGTGNIRRFGDAQFGGGQFFKDAAAGTLPPVVYIDPAFGENDDHPPVHPILGQELIAAIYNALATSPQWENILFVVTYDENGGFFDHVAPPQTTDDTEANFGVPGFEQMGARVPTMVIGPYVKQNYVSSVTYDHTSALKHLADELGLETLNPRMSAANNLMDCIDLDRLAAGDPAPPIDIPLPDRFEWPTTSERCMSSGGFRTLDPITEWAEANPGRFPAEYDLRGQTNDHKLIYDYVAQQRAARSRK
jgi:phospholipase C